MSAIPADPMRGYARVSAGTTGRVRIGGVYVGALTSWYITINPEHQTLTLIGQGHFRRYFTQGAGCHISADLEATQPHHYIGRPKPKRVKPATITGTLHTLTPTAITIVRAVRG